MAYSTMPPSIARVGRVSRHDPFQKSPIKRLAILLDVGDVADAAYSFIFDQVRNDVVATENGSRKSSGLTFATTFTIAPSLLSNLARQGAPKLDTIIGCLGWRILRLTFRECFRVGRRRVLATGGMLAAPRVDRKS